MTGPLGGIATAAPSVAILTAIACAIGGGWLLVKRRERLKGVLMLVMAVVLVGNVLIWTL